MHVVVAGREGCEIPSARVTPKAPAVVPRLLPRHLRGGLQIHALGAHQRERRVTCLALDAEGKVIHVLLRTGSVPAQLFHDERWE